MLLKHYPIRVGQAQCASKKGTSISTARIEKASAIPVPRRRGAPGFRLALPKHWDCFGLENGGALDRSTARVASKRLRARAAGLCCTCFKNLPEAQRRSCRSCSDAAAERVVRRRTEKRKAAELTAAVRVYERVGDEAGSRHAYADAAESTVLSVSCARPARMMGLVKKPIRPVRNSPTAVADRVAAVAMTESSPLTIS